MFKPPFMRSAFNYDVEAASNAAMIPADEQGVSLTVQSMSEDADINVIMERFGITGKFPETLRVPEFGDYSEVTDFRGALDAVNAAYDSFMSIPANIRAKFDNSPQRFLEFCAEPSNRAEIDRLGLTKVLRPKPEDGIIPPKVEIPSTKKE